MTIYSGQRVYIGFSASRKASDAPDLAMLREINGKLVRFSYAWWFWMPRIRWNRGKFWCGQYTEIHAQWLRFVVSLGISGKSKHTHGSQIAPMPKRGA